MSTEKMRPGAYRTPSEARGLLRDILRPGDVVHTVLRDVSRDGMNRSIDLVKLEHDRERGPWSRWLSRYVYEADIGGHWDQRRECIRVGGCGMDMGFALVYNLSAALYPDGWRCIGKRRRCPSNDHSNGAPIDGRMKHRDGGYALRHVWL